MTTALLFGATGMLGSDLAAAVPADTVLIGRSRREVDVTDSAAVRATIAETRPDLVLNAAAYTGVDAAESDSRAAYAVNAEAPRILAEALAQSITPKSRPALLVHFSTDYVFDGSASTPYKEDAPVKPLGVYGASKLLGEVAIREVGAPAIIIRTQWLFGAHGHSFPQTMWRRACAQTATRVVNDQVGRPTYTVDLARAAWRLATLALRDRNASADPVDLFHVANHGTATWYDVAHEIFTHARAERYLTPCHSSAYPTAARRPSWSVLDTTKAEHRLQAPLPHWRDALRRFLLDI